MINRETFICFGYIGLLVVIERIICYPDCWGNNSLSTFSLIIDYIDGNSKMYLHKESPKSDERKGFLVLNFVKIENKIKTLWNLLSIW